MQPRGVPDPDRDLRIDFFPKARDRHECLRADFLKVVEDCLGAFGEVDGRGRGDRRVYRKDPLQDVTQRQETQLIVRVEHRPVPQSGRDGIHQIAMADHRALGLAGRAGCIDQNGGVFWFGGVDGRVKGVRVRRVILCTEFVKLVHEHDLRIREPMQPFAFNHDNLKKAGHLVPDLQKLVQLFVVFDQQKPAF